ncbi:MAG: FecR domain-containing protein [Acidobacteriota bacterium]
MSDDERREEASRAVPEASGDDSVGGLLRRAGPRPEVPEEAVAELWEVSRGAWRDAVDRRAGGRSRPRRGWWMGVAAAAALLLAVVLPRWRALERTGEPVATLTYSAGEVVATNEGRSFLSRGGDQLLASTTVETVATSVASARAALELVGGPQVRLDAGTRLRLVSASTVALEKGAIYVDSSGATIEIETLWGVARNLGTRFEARIRPAAAGTELRLRIRQGRVAIERNGAINRVQTGEELTVRADGTVSRRRIDPHSVEWDWIRSAAAPFAIEGRPLREFLDWIVAENGWTLESLPEDLEPSRLDKTLHGNIDGLDAEGALQVVLPGYGLSYRLVDGRLWIEPTS